jgi:hypothetical protein
MIQEIAIFIASRTGFAIGSTLQVGHRAQDAPARHVLVSEAGGGEANPDFPDMANLVIQVLSRGKTYMDAREDIWDVYRAIHGTAGWDLPNWYSSGDDYLAMTVDAIATPHYIGVDPNRLHEFSCNFIFRMEQATCGSGSPGP